MPTLIGNIFLSIAALIFLALFNMMYLQKIPKTGDSLMGYGWGIILGYLAILTCLILVAGMIGWKGGFSWIGASTAARWLIVPGGLILAVLAAGLCAFIKGEPMQVPGLLKWLSGVLPALIPLFLFIGFAVLLNGGEISTLSAAAYKWPLASAGSLGMLGLCIAAWGFIAESNQNAVRRAEGAKSDQARYHQNHLDNIDSCDVTKNMVFILVFTDANHHPEVRERAIAKIKTNPAWQQELIRLLECDWAPEAFTFLASNEVDDKNLFVEPVRKGVLNQAKLIRQNIRESSQRHHLYAGKFSWEVERMLRTVDKFQSAEANYLPEVREVRAALNERWIFEKPTFVCAAVLDKWINKHQ